MILPNVIIAGAPKCGTTSLFEWLSAHPEVCVSSRKETGYFMEPAPGPHDADVACPGTRRGRDLAAYGRFFAHCGTRAGVTAILEATPDYFDQPSAIAAVPSLPSAPTIVFILRRPALRIYSSYQFSRNNLATLPKRLTFGEFVGLARGGAPGPAAAVARQAFEQTRYARHIARWIAAAGRDRVGIFLFEDLRSDQAGFMRRLSNRIGITAGFWDSYNFRRINAGYRVKSQGVHRLVRRLTAAAPALVRNERLKKLYGLLNKEQPAGIPPEDAVVIAELDRQFRPLDDELARLAGIDLSCWRQRV